MSRDLHRIARIEKYIEKEMANYKRLWTEDIKAKKEIDCAMDREGMRVLIKIKGILEEE